ncbi:Sodium-dependent multivitamin transporter [Lamellibrachia satsuma]|nr:Sodium-dependent multivitamin transporter [Lamellibrachia satsuma]
MFGPGPARPGPARKFQAQARPIPARQRWPRPGPARPGSRNYVEARPGLGPKARPAQGTNRHHSIEVQGSLTPFPLVARGTGITDTVHRGGKRKMASMHWLDYAIFVALLLVSLSIGLYHGCTGGRQKTTAEFLLANRKLKVIPTVISMMVSFQSAIMVLGFVSEMYTYGIAYWPGRMLSVSIGLVIIERLVVPWFYPLKLTSVFEYFELRFRSRSVRELASALGICSAIMYMGLAMYAPSLALDYVSGLPLSVTAPTMGVVCVCYTAMGGMRAVIWTDVFQCAVMFGGLLTVIVKGCVNVGGFGKVFHLANEGGRIFWIPLDADPRVRLTLWEFVIGGVLFYISVYGVSQFSVQRYCSTATMRDARKTVLWIIPPIFITMSIAAVTGFVVFAYYTVIGCDPLANHQIATGNELLPHFVKTAFADSKGFCGVVIAILYSGSLSSISSSLSGAAANTWEDILKPRLGNINEYKAALLNKGIVIVYGLTAVALVFIIDLLPGPILQVSAQILGAIGSPLFGMFLLGGLFRKVEAKGAIAGGILGFAATSFANVGSLTVAGYHRRLPPTRMDGCEPLINSTEMVDDVSISGISNLYAMSFMWYTPLGAGVTVITGLAVSYVVRFLFPNEAMEEEVPDKLFIQFGNLFCSRDTEDDARIEECEYKEPSLIVEMSIILNKEDAESDTAKEVEMTSLMRKNSHLRQSNL